jgi:hypothetical protein
MMPLLYRNFAALAIDDPQLPGLKGMYRYWWAANQRLFNQAADALQTLDAAGLETMVLKGAPLTLLHYRDMGTRPMMDMDILVRPQSAAAALRALTYAGWTPRNPGMEVGALRAGHAISLRRQDGAEIDLHWRVLHQAARDDEVWEARVPVTVAHASTSAPSPTDQLLHVCVHGLAANPAVLRWVADAVTVSRTAELDWDRLLESGVARRVTLPLRAALAYLRDAYEVPVPERILVELGAAHSTPSDRWGHWAALYFPRRGRRYVAMWERYRRLRTLEHEFPVPTSYLQFVADVDGRANRREVVLRLARKAARGARPGSSEPTGVAVRTGARGQESWR